MFPNILDDALVHFYTQKDNYGSVFYDKFEVIADYLFDSIEECKNMANKSKKEIVWIKNNCNEIY
ncbi:hypothetical protein [Fusobacterium animalis]|uniref:hypothetical protein n=1 Tax=Fusobacterium animalis TaxID=76859 RepID=UPI0030CDB193